MKYNKHLLAISLATTLAACSSDGDGNAAPEFSADTYNLTLTEDGSISDAVSATDDNNDELVFSVASAASNGVFALNADGSFTYTPSANFNGTDIVSVQVSDGESNSRANIVFSVEATNDAPLLNTTNITVTTSGTTTGLIDVSDIDGDNITFAIVSQPAFGTVELDSATGEFTYAAAELTDVAGTFTISYTDGVIATPIEAVINLAPSYVTNEDKANYYYSSAHSHLKQAEAIKASINDDTYLDDINTELAISYLLAGFEEKANAIFDEITLTNVKAYAYRRTATALEELEQADLALNYLSKSLANYNQFIADKGINNFSRDDASFLLALVNDYVSAEQSEQAEQLITTLTIYADAIRTEEYDISYAFLLTSFANYAEETALAYLQDKKDSNYERAKAASVLYADMASQTGYQTETRGDYIGERSERIKALYVSRAAKFLFNIGAIEEAKDATNLALSIYGVGNYDENYAYEASPYAAVTLAVYNIPLEDIAGLVTGLYPEQDSNAAIDLLTDDWSITGAQEASYASDIITKVESGMSVTEATEAAFEYFEQEDDLRTLYQTLVEFADADPRAGVLLNLRGYEEASKEVLLMAADLLVSEAYIEDQPYNSYLTGYKGCARLTRIMQSYSMDAEAQAQKCETIASHIAAKTEIFSTTKVVTAYKDLLGTYHFVSDLESIKANLPKLTAEIDKIEDAQDLAEEKLELATRLMHYGATAEAQTILFEALSLFTAFVENSEDEDALEDTLEEIDSFLFGATNPITGFWDTPNFVDSMKAHANQIDNYVDFYQQVMTRLATETGYYTAAILASSDAEIIANMETLIHLNFAIGNLSKVDELINHELNEEADKLAYNTYKAQLFAIMDAFKNSHIASVDTDNDGLPNFFLPSASEEDITASGLVLDTDADNDGIEDSLDTAPLDANQ